ncbi:hypothetical protein PGSY75_1416000 [Plasmodium gaboni]|uniref:Uncharacterized protein n=1 Tax=Plasmodium gaboni TaxID=647221 RepID=A0A151L9Z5_9APIC|nr:hypothetical protein PGSY75_1416000 [Plasmodium gaboni]KYN95771.1 hypothetical protein PGSY75_1416000 [Plasmodium gaboni]SOV18786.1 conserved Plasmodium protein, unknown function [Plasmodium gaboni]SOV24901.1 conserved Plasmodium protein, unknown function [Plasmodium sp. DRC-Itaito]
MNVQKIVTFCFAISYLLYCHIIWNGCYNIYSSSEDEVYNLLYYRKKEPKTVKLEIRNKLKIKDIQKVYVKKTPCPVLPRPIKSIFHLNWFRKSPDLIPISIQLYSMFDEKNNFLGFVLLCSAIFTIIEWIYLVYLVGSLLWDGVIKPIFKILYMGISVYLIIRFSVLFLPYTKSYFSQENYRYLSSFILHSYNLITKISKEFGNVFNKVIQENSVVEKEL